MARPWRRPDGQQERGLFFSEVSPLRVGEGEEPTGGGRLAGTELAEE